MRYGHILGPSFVFIKWTHNTDLALLSYFFYERFGVSESVIAVLFLGARGMNAVSHLGAAWLAKRIGLVNTMVFTHIPSSLLLVTVAFAPKDR